MKKKIDKKGFTLIELLAVIVILAVLILFAMPAVMNLMEKARKNAFKDEVMKILDDVETAYADKSMNGETKYYVEGGKRVQYLCMTLQDLYSEGYNKKNFDKAGYKGIVEVIITPTGAPVYGINITTGTYSFVAATSDKLQEDGVGLGSESSLTNYAGKNLEVCPTSNSKEITSGAPVISRNDYETGVLNPSKFSR